MSRPCGRDEDFGGAEALRQAAKDALKQYEYAPATQGGKAVASKLVVTVKFWFDP